MSEKSNAETQFLGDLPPLLTREHSKIPERRQVSKRWLAGSMMVALTSSFLMGGALFAALEGREQLAVPAQFYQDYKENFGVPTALRGDHPGLIARLSKEKTNIMMVSTVSKQIDKDVVKVRPFKIVSGLMATSPRPQADYPDFNPLKIFSESGDLEFITDSSDVMYGGDVEGEVTLSVVDFPYQEASKTSLSRQKSAEIAQQIRAIAHSIKGGSSHISALAYFDNEQDVQFDKASFSATQTSVTFENVSIIPRIINQENFHERYEERLIKVRANAAITTIFQSEGISSREADKISEILESDLGSDSLRTGDRLQTWFKHKTDSTGKPVKTTTKVSLYRSGTHLVSVARNDDGKFVYAIPTENAEDVFDSNDKAPLVSSTKLPTVYDGIYRTAVKEGLPNDLVASLIKIFAFNVDLRSRISAQDQLEVFVSLEEGNEDPTANSEILYTSLKLGNNTRRYYRFRDTETGRVDYYDETGKSAKNFLIRNPVPSGRFTSGFGMRLHPVHRVRRMHWGVDWAAPRGTPIIAAGDGVVVKAGWAGGYGRQLVVRHLNGYETMYAHLSAFGRGIRPGAKVRQGQVIARVGNTGVSTGPHLHYELKINGKRVDPVRVRLPKGNVLRGDNLIAFETERDRIDALINSNKGLEVASN